MTITKVKFNFKEVRDFLVESYSKYPKQHNWLIDRWNFVRYTSQIMHNTYQTWPDTVGVWKDNNDNIVALVNSEGENGGEAFIQLSNYSFSKDDLNNFIDHLETLPKGFDDEYFLQVRINKNNNELKALLKSRDYEFNNWYEETSSMIIEKFYNIELPKGFKIKTGSEVSDYEKGFAHGKAFGYYKNNLPQDDNGERALKSMKNAPDYNPELDLTIVDKEGRVASFINIWFDRVNKIGVLEPVGTIPKYQRMGLAKNLIHYGINKIKKMGATKIYVGSDQDFYISIGFKVEYKKEVWYKGFPKS